MNRGGSRTLLSLLVALAALFACSTIASAAPPWEQPGLSSDPKAVLESAKAIPVDKDSDVDVLFVDRRYEIDAQGCVTQTSRWVYRVNTSDGVKNWSEISAIWEPWHQVKPEINVSVITPDGAVHMLDPKTLVDAPARNNAEATFDDDRKYHGPIPAVTIGAIVEEYIVLRDTTPFFEGGGQKRIWFGTNMPVQQTRLVVESPVNSPFRYSVHELPNASVKKEQVDGKIRLTVEHGFIEARRKQEPNLPNDVIRWPHVDFTTAASWQDVAKLYNKSVEERIRTADVKDFLPAKAPKATRQQTIQTLVSHLHKEVRYTGVEFGRSKLIPQTPAEVLKRKYGDCKDKAALLVTMLRASGIPANVALLTSSDTQDAEDDMPGLNLFDHAIVFVPGNKNTQDLWIDATADFSPVGILPTQDQGRMALIISDQTKGLVRTSEAKSTDNVNVETREFYLAETGPARVVELCEWGGNLGAYMRSYYETISEEKRKNLENYVKNTYLAESLVNAETSDAHDMTRTFSLRLESSKARRGTTADYDAAVALWPAGLLNNLPPALRQTDDEDKEDKSAKKKPERKLDFLLPEAFVSEWRYKVIPPPGFQAHALPENKIIPIGPARLSQEFKTETDGSITGILRFDSVKRRYTVAEMKEIQTAVQKAYKAPATLITFDSTGYVLLKAGKIRESLAEYRKLIALHPSEGLHHAQLASVLLQAGLGETARTEARKATTLDTKSSDGFKTLGWILQHDLVGRRFERGFDLDGSIAAYRKAIELDPKDAIVKADLAILLEHDKDGQRYATGAKLDESITLYREIRNMDKQKPNTDYDNNLLYDLFYARRFKEAIDFADELPASAATNAITLASIAGSEGAEKAIAESSKASQNENERNGALYDAGTLLARIRMYPEALKLMSAGVSSQTNSPQVLGSIEAIRNTKKLEDIPQSTKTPEDVVRAAMIALLSSDDPQKALKLSSKNSLDDGKPEKDHLKQLDRARRQFQTMLKQGEWPLIVAEDMTFSNMKVFKDGDDATGYRMTMEWMGSKPDYMYVVKEDGEYKLLSGSGNDMADTGREALMRARSGDLVGARKVLDWAREQLKAGDGNDPLDGPPARKFWTRGLNGDKETIEYAAASLMITDPSAKRAIPILEQGRAKATTDNDKLKFDLALAPAYAQAKQWKEASDTAQRLLKAEPLSDLALNYLLTASMQLKDFSTLNKAVEERLQKTPDDPEAIRFSARVQEFQSNFDKYREITKKMIDSGKGGADDMNGYAWAALFTGKVTADDIELARRGLGMEGNRNYAIMHTLACLYADVGKTKEARDLLVNAMDVASMDEPNESVWYGFARIAEQYGEYEAARDAYKRVDTDEGEKESALTPFATVNLMKSRMKVVEAELAKTPAAAVAK